MQGQDTVIVVVMEFCDLGSLLRAVNKKAFKPHSKWSYHTTYVSHKAFCKVWLQQQQHEPDSCAFQHPQTGCVVFWN